MCLLFRLITEKIKEIDQQIAEVKSKKSNEYKLHLQKLINTKNSQCQVAILKKEFEKENLYHKHKAQEQSILQNYKVIFLVSQGLDKYTNFFFYLVLSSFCFIFEIFRITIFLKLIFN